MEKNNQYRINGKIFKFVQGFESPYGYNYIFICEKTNEKIIIEEQTPQEIAEEKIVWGIK